MKDSKAFQEHLHSILKPVMVKMSEYDRLVKIKYDEEMSTENSKALFYLDLYNKKVNCLISYLNSAEELLNQCDKEYSDLVQNISKKSQENIEAINTKREVQLAELAKQFSIQKNIIEATKATLINAIPEQDGYAMIKNSVQELERVFQLNIESDHKNSEYRTLDGQSLILNQLKEVFDTTTKEIIGETKAIIDQFAIIESKYFNQYFESSADELKSISEKASSMETHIFPVLNIADSSIRINLLESSFDLKIQHYLPFAHNSGILIKNDEDLDPLSLRIVDRILLRILASTKPGMVELHLIDCVDFQSFKEYRRLETLVYNRYDDETQVTNLLTDLHKDIRDRYNNQLKADYESLLDFNIAKNGTEPYKVLIFMNYPQGASSSSINLLVQIVKNGPKAGVFPIVMVNKEEVDVKDSISTNGYQIDNLKKHCRLIELNDKVLESNINLTYSLKDLTDKAQKDYFVTLLESINSATKDSSEVYRIEDFYLSEDEWWKSKTDKEASIPIGLGPDKEPVELKFSREDGQNTSLLIGNPGSGKSAVLHNIILNGAAKYSPDELQFYLIDFSANAFNIYGEKKLPHTRVIASEVDVELAVQILSSLQSEAVRRMDLLRTKKVEQYDDYRKAYPKDKLPRIILVIDEFQELFNNKELIDRSQDILARVVRKWAKFGIHCVLATQNLSFSGFEKGTRDEIGVRLVMKASASSAYDLLDVDNKIHRKVVGKGQGVINNNFGRLPAKSQHQNTLFQGFLAKNERSEFYPKGFKTEVISKMQDKSSREGLSSDCIIFDSTLKGNSIRLKAILEDRYRDEKPNYFDLYLGEQYTLQDRDFSVALSNKDGNNVFICGGELDVRLRIVYSMILSILHTHREGQFVLTILDFLPKSDLKKRELTSLIELIEIKYKDSIQIFDKETLNTVSQDELGEDISNFTHILNQYKEHVSDSKKKSDNERAEQKNNFIFYLGLDNSDVWDLGEDNQELEKNLMEILLDGPKQGLFTFFEMNRYNSLGRLFDFEDPLPLFNHKVALQMTETEGRKFLDGKYNIDVNKIYDPFKPQTYNRAIYSGIDDYAVKLNPYEIVIDQIFKTIKS